MNAKIILLLILLLPIVSAVEFEMKSNLSQDETFIAKISGNFFEPVTKDKIIFRREHVRVPVIPFVIEIEDEFYIYAQLLGKQPGNYSIVVENAKFIKAGEIIEEDLISNFTILSNNSDFTIDPGFIVTNEDFFIEVQNLKDNKITVKYRILNESESTSGGFFGSFFGGGESGEQGTSVEVKSGEIKKINFNKELFEPLNLQKIKLFTENTAYEIPVYITESESSISKTSKKIKFQPSDLSISIPTNSNTTRVIYLFNLADNDIDDIILSVSDSLKPYVSISTEKISLDSNSSEKIEIVFFSESEEKFLEGEIKAETINDTISIFVSLNFLKDFTPESTGKEICSEIGGTICQEDFKCEGNIEYTSDGVCCLGICNEESDRGSAGIIIGWVLIIFVVLGIIWFYLKKYKGIRNPIDLLKIARGR